MIIILLAALSLSGQSHFKSLHFFISKSLLLLQIRWVCLNPRKKTNQNASKFAGIAQLSVILATNPLFFSVLTLLRNSSDRAQFKGLGRTTY